MTAGRPHLLPPSRRRSRGPAFQGQGRPRPVRAGGPARESRGVLAGRLRSGNDRLIRGFAGAKPLGEGLGSIDAQPGPARGGGGRGAGIRRAQDRDRPGRRGPTVDGGLGPQGIAHGCRTDHQPNHRCPGLDHHLERQRLVAVVRRLPCAGSRRSRTGTAPRHAGHPFREVSPSRARPDRVADRRILETTRALLEAWKRGGGSLPMPLEKDFSPTLAGSDLAAARPTVLGWLRQVPELIRDAALREKSRSD